MTYTITRLIKGRNRGPAPRDGRLDAAVGYPDDGGYPPWAFVSGWLFLWPSWPLAL